MKKITLIFEGVLVQVLKNQAKVLLKEVLIQQLNEIKQLPIE
ncbi:hypothetical protein [Candidatus Ruthia endofausta]|nr:hypothetical protein [Candidatus Ruthia endofausta]